MKIALGMSFPSGKPIPWIVADIRGTRTRLTTADLKFETWRDTGYLESLADRLLEAGYDPRPQTQLRPSILCE